ncbi:MAG: hypothetical protein AAB513_01865 [Patescibacteria group bacterium]
MIISSLQKQNRLIFKAVSVFVVLAFLFSPILPAKKVEALVVSCPVCEAILTTISTVSTYIIGGGIAFLVTKEKVLDPIFKMIARMILRGITQSIIQWAAGGFQGNPSFIQNPTQFFANVADQAIGQIIYNNAGLQWMCSPFRLQLKRALIYNRSFTQRSQCTLTGIVGNYEGFISGVNNELGTLGGWNAWNVMATQPENNPYGAYALFNLQVEAAITTDKTRELNLLNWGKGFFSWKEPGCVQRAMANKQIQDTRDVYEGEGGGAPLPQVVSEDAAGNVNLYDRVPENTNPNKCDTITPGSVIADSVNKALGAGQDELIAADEIGEVLGAVLYGLVTNVLGDAGLFGAGGGGGVYSNDYEAQVEQEDREVFQTTKNDTVSQIVSSANDENSYIATKNQSIARIEISAQKVRDIIGCYQQRIALAASSTEPVNIALFQNEIASASTTLAQVLLRKAPLQRDISIGENNLNNLNSLGDRMSALPYERRDSFRSLANEFANLLSQIHYQGDVIQAEYERDFTIPESLKTIDTQSDQKFQQCQNPPETNNQAV